METKKEIASLSAHEFGVTAVAFNNIGTILASGSGDGIIKFWSLETKTEIATLSEQESGVTSVAFNKTGTILASGLCNNTINLWNKNLNR